MNFSIVIPLYNEEYNILELVDEIFFNLNFINTYEIILVNDSSTDNTLKKISDLKKKHPNIIKIINNEKNLGQSLSLVKGIKLAIFNTIVTLDGDGQNNPKDISNLTDKYISNKDVSLVGGIRKNRKDNITKRYASFVANNFRRLILKDGCKDTGCSLKVFNKNIFLSFPVFDGMHRFLPALFKGCGYKTIFVKVDHRSRIFGVSKYGTIDRFYKGLIDIIRVLRIIKNYKQNND